MTLTVLMRGGGDLASGVAVRLAHAGMQVIITELEMPLVVRRSVAYAEAVYAGRICVEGIWGIRVGDSGEVDAIFKQAAIPVLVDPAAEIRYTIHPEVLVDARMLKRPPELGLEAAALTIGLGPGFQAGVHCHAVIETNRGPNMGRVIWNGRAEADTGVPEAVSQRKSERVLRAPATGIIKEVAKIGQHVESGQRIAEVSGQPVLAPFAGVLRGLVHSGIVVSAGMKIGDLDPRDDPALCTLVSDKALAVGGGVLEAILSRADLRSRYCQPE